ncbi:MAG: hypothetical protein PHW31_04210 [Candidatus Pacebacteria bacterium]|nr:hypothetical protein [Candidatus Paceibacterota bacterium]
MDQKQNNYSKDTEDEEFEKNRLPEADIDPRKLNLTLVIGGILLIFLMWYISTKLF